MHNLPGGHILPKSRDDYTGSVPIRGMECSHWKGPAISMCVLPQGMVPVRCGGSSLYNMLERILLPRLWDEEPSSLRGRNVER